MLFPFRTHLNICLDKIQNNFRLLITRVVFLILQGKSRKNSVSQFFVTLTHTKMVGPASAELLD